MKTDGDLTQEEKKEKQVEKAKKRAMSSSVVQELQAQYGDAPVEIKVIYMKYCDVCVEIKVIYMKYHDVSVEIEVINIV